MGSSPKTTSPALPAAAWRPWSPAARRSAPRSHPAVSGDAAFSLTITAIRLSNVQVGDGSGPRDESARASARAASPASGPVQSPPASRAPGPHAGCRKTHPPASRKREKPCPTAKSRAAAPQTVRQTAYRGLVADVPKDSPDPPTCDEVIASIFESAAGDETASLISAALAEAHARGSWTPRGLTSVADDARSRPTDIPRV